jgi:hypothetical protein
MKRGRKLTIEIEHREITVALSLQGGSLPFGPSARSQTTNGGADACPSCGAAGLVPLERALASYGGDQEALSRAFTVGDIHISRVGNALWVCERSFKSFLTTLPLDSKEIPQ